MTKEEYKAKMQEILKDPASSAEKAADFLKSLDEDLTAFESLQAADKQKDDKIRDLQDSNYKLFLRVTGEPDDSSDDPAPLDTAIKSIFDTEGGKA